MLGRMSLWFDSFWRALAYCFRPRVFVLSLAPLLLIVLLASALAYGFWDSAVARLHQSLDASVIVGTFTDWLQTVHVQNLNALLAPLLLVLLATPLIVVISLLLVSLLMTPALTELVARQRFPDLQRQPQTTLLASLGWSLLSSGMALVALVVSMPLWLVPPLVLVLPPLIWGWLTYRVMAFDALSAHANTAEREAIFRRHRWTLLGIGVTCGFLGAAPSVIWASGVVFAVAFAVLIPVGIWLYTLVFAFSSLWFAHFCLSALAQLRQTALTPDRGATIDL